MTDTQEGRPITEGEYLVGIDFNPGGHEQVNLIKKLTAELIDYVNKHGEDGRTKSLAKTHYEDAAMWAVKSITKPVRPSSI